MLPAALFTAMPTVETSVSLDREGINTSRYNLDGILHSSECGYHGRQTLRKRAGNLLESWSQKAAERDRDSGTRDD